MIIADDYYQVGHLFIIEGMDGPPVLLLFRHDHTKLASYFLGYNRFFYHDSCWRFK